ncbi:MAG: fluoride efflux transporter CrcB [Luteolibacter sp.]
MHHPTRSPMHHIWIFIGGGLGAVARVALANAVTRRVGDSFPWGILSVNLIGSLAIGWIAAVVGSAHPRMPVDSEMRSFLMLGLLGGFTTFSSFSYQTMEMLRAGEWLKAGGNVIASVSLCLAGAWLGGVGARLLAQGN